MTVGTFFFTWGILCSSSMRSHREAGIQDTIYYYCTSASLYCRCMSRRLDSRVGARAPIPPRPPRATTRRSPLRQGMSALVSWKVACLSEWVKWLSRPQYCARPMPRRGVAWIQRGWNYECVLLFTITLSALQVWGIQPELLALAVHPELHPGLHPELHPELPHQRFMAPSLTSSLTSTQPHHAPGLISSPISAPEALRFTTLPGGMGMTRARVDAPTPSRITHLG